MKLSDEVLAAVWAAAYVAVLASDAGGGIHQTAEQLREPTEGRLTLAVTAANGAIRRLEEVTRRLTRTP